MVNTEQQEEAERRHVNHYMTIMWWLGCLAGSGATIIILLIAGELT